MFVTKVCFVLDHALKEYRVPFFNQLSQKGFLIIIMHPGKFQDGLLPEIDQQPFDSCFFFGFKKVNFGFHFDADVIVHMQNIRLPSLWAISLNPFRKAKIIHWGIGTSSSKGLDQESKAIRSLRNFLSRFSDALILYSDFPLGKFPTNVQKRTYIAHNTVYSPMSADFSGEEKNSFLFIGSLNVRKGLFELVKAFALYLQINGRKIDILNIVGDGPLKSDLEDLVRDLAISNNVLFHGNLQKDADKINFYKTALVSISPKQAGLSVLECFSYGVPFIAFENAISGGEHLNIRNDENGYLIKSESEIVEKMIFLDSDRNAARNLGSAAFQFYQNERTMAKMVDVFCDAIKVVSI